MGTFTPRPRQDVSLFTHHMHGIRWNGLNPFWILPSLFGWITQEFPEHINKALG
jgi:hypothetical protein